MLDSNETAVSKFSNNQTNKQINSMVPYISSVLKSKYVIFNYLQYIGDVYGGYSGERAKKEYK
ncbi:MAG: hypothetical protein WBH77_02985 [Saccharofermentanales bacterium]